MQGPKILTFTKGTTGQGADQKTKQNNHTHTKKELVKCRASFRVGVLRRTLGREGKEGYVDGVWSWGVIAPRGEV